MVKTERVTITAEMAEQLLSVMHQGQTRRLAMPHVKKLANIMTLGHWQDYNGDTIVLDTANRVIDGQHRLWAVVRSKVPLKTLMVTGVKPDAYYSIDVQSKPRNVGDILKIEGYERSGDLSAALRAAWQYDNDCMQHYHHIPTSQQLCAVLNNNEELFIRATKKTKGINKVMAGSHAIFLYCLFAKYNTAKADIFFSQLGSGEGMYAKSPIRLLRDRLLVNKASRTKLPRLEVLALAIIAWNSFCDNKKRSVLRWQLNRAGVLVFPKAKKHCEGPLFTM